MSKKYIAHLTQAQYEALQRMEEQPTQEQPPTQPQPKSGGMDGFTMILLILIGLMVALGASAGEIDWQYTSDYSESIARCQARESGDAYPQFGSHEKNCMLHNGFSPIVENGHLIDWDDMQGNKHLAEGWKP